MSNIRTTKSAVIRAFFQLRNKEISFAQHPYQMALLDRHSKRKLFKCSRQVGKSAVISLDLGGDIILGAEGIRDLRMIYVTPSWTQTKTFVIEKLRPLLWNDSPLFKAKLLSRDCTNEIQTQTFANNAQLYLRAAHHNADRIRGIPADKIAIDEVQSMLKVNIPVIESCLNASDVNELVMAGTPLSEENTIEDYWRESSQTEWVVPCSRHTPIVWNIPDKKCIGKKGMICKKCGELINPLEGRWVDTHFQPDGSPVFWKGFHINQLITAKSNNPELWRLTVLNPYETWPTAQFDNEVLGISSGRAGRLLTTEKMVKCCHPQSKTSVWDSSRWYDAPPTKRMKWFAGVDWGEGRENASIEDGKKKNASFTHLIIGGFDEGNVFRLAYWKKYRGTEAEPDVCVPHIIETCRQWNVELIGVDHGHGWGVNKEVMKALPGKLIQFFESSELKELCKFHAISNMMTLNRNATISDLVDAIDKQKVGFPPWNITSALGKDFLAEFAEYNYVTGRMQYSHSIQEPDDGLHATMYARFAAMFALGMVKTTYGS